MQLELEALKPLSQVDQKLPGLLLVLEAHHGIVGIPHDDDVAARMPPPPLVNPKVVGVVQVDVRKERRNRRALWRAHLTD
jgi:hypothetical protein